MTPVTKRNIIIAVLLFFALALGGGGGYTVGQARCAEQIVKIEAPPCVCECVFDIKPLDCGIVGPPPPCPECAPCPELECPEVTIEPAHYIGPTAGYADGWIAGAGYSYVKPRWMLDASIGHRWADEILVDRYDYRWKKSTVDASRDSWVLLASWRWKLK